MMVFFTCLPLARRVAQKAMHYSNRLLMNLCEPVTCPGELTAT
jgi:hypothetical protein